jgi:hypothetical protein
MDSIGGGVSGRGVGRDDKGFMPGATQMLDYPDRRVADAVDVREKGLCDNRYAHITIVSPPPVGKVADGHTACKICSIGKGRSMGFGADDLC